MVSQHALQVSGLGCIPACLATFQAHTQRGAWGVWPGGVSMPTPWGEATAVGGTRPTGMHSC